MSDEPTGEGTTTALADGEVGLADLQRTIRRGFALVLIQLALFTIPSGSGSSGAYALWGGVGAIGYLFVSVVAANTEP